MPEAQRLDLGGGLVPVITRRDLLATDRGTGDVDLASLLDTGDRVEVETGGRSEPPTLTSVLPPVLTCDAPLGATGLSEAGLRRLGRATHQHRAVRNSPIMAAITRFFKIFVFPFVSRRPDGSVVSRSLNSTERYRSQEMSVIAGNVPL